MTNVIDFKAFSEKQLKVLSFWCDKQKNYDAIICDGSVRSGKTICMIISFFLWSCYSFNDSAFAICGKTIRSVKRNVISPILSTLKTLGFCMNFKNSENILEISYKNTKNKYYFFGGKDQSSSGLIQGMTLSGVLFDEVALMPQNFVQQAIARCSVEKSKFWFNCNPEYPGHWFYRDWILQHKQKNALYIHFTMKDNPSLSPKMIARYESLYTGTFYQRFIKGEWVNARGIIYPFMSEKNMFFDPPDENSISQFAVSCDYGTVNPSSFGLWAKSNNIWYRINEYYFDSKAEGYQKTDEEHYTGLKNLIDNKIIDCIVVDPSAASFIEVIKRHNEFNVKPAQNKVLDGIRKVSTALKEQQIRICKNCSSSIREFSIYRWSDDTSKEAPIKENDHAMDDIRYFVTTIMNDYNNDFFAFASSRT